MVKTISEMNAYKLRALLNKWESYKILMQKQIKWRKQITAPCFVSGKSF